MADERYQWLDQEAAERLLRGEPVEAFDDRVRAQAERLAEALGTARTPAVPSAAHTELPGEAAALAAFRKATAERAAAAAASAVSAPAASVGRTAVGDLGRVRLAPVTAPARRWGRSVRYGLAAAVAAVTVGGVAVAAGTGVLPLVGPSPASSVTAAETTDPRVSEEPGIRQDPETPPTEPGAGDPTPGSSPSADSGSHAPTPASRTGAARSLRVPAPRHLAGRPEARSARTAPVRRTPGRRPSGPAGTTGRASSTPPAGSSSRTPCATARPCAATATGSSPATPPARPRTTARPSPAAAARATARTTPKTPPTRTARAARRAGPTAARRTAPTTAPTAGPRTAAGTATSAAPTPGTRPEAAFRTPGPSSQSPPHCPSPSPPRHASRSRCNTSGPADAVRNADWSSAAQRAGVPPVPTAPRTRRGWDTFPRSHPRPFLSCRPYQWTTTLSPTFTWSKRAESLTRSRTLTQPCEAPA